MNTLVENTDTAEANTAPQLVVDNQLEVAGLHKKYGSKIAAQNIHMRIGRGEAVGLFGPNGAGKTTTFYMIAGLLMPESGQISLDGEDITYLPTYLRAKHGLVYLPQEMSIFRGLSVAENILAVLEIYEPAPDRQQQRLVELLEQFRLEHLYHTPSMSLSGGERRKLEIARLLAGNPKYVLMDEPLAGIDPLAIGEIRRRIELLCQQGIGVCITDHNVRDSLQMVDRAYIVHDGQIFREGSPEEIAHDEDVRRVYLGENFRL